MRQQSRSSAPAVAIRDLHVHRGKRDVLPDLSLEVPHRTVVGLLGPSGCGKSTLMRAIVGVQDVLSGEISVLGEPAGSPGLRRRVGYVTQAPSVYADLTVRENLRYFARVLGVPGERAEAVLSTVDLERPAGQLAGDLSGGERARCSLAVALLAEPELLILDEPTVGLDPVLRRQLWSTFHELAAAGSSILVSTHVMDEAERCDHVILMREGRIVAQDAPAALLQQTDTENFEDAFLAIAEDTVAT